MAHQSLKPSTVLVALLIASLCTQGAQSQAPGDEIKRCNTGSFTHTYEEGMKPLMDTYNYEQILGVTGAVWDEADFDNNNIQSAITQTKWKHSVGGVCRWSVQSCGSTIGVQENWAFTQYISKAAPAGTNYDVKVCVQISYRISNCRSRNGCNPEFEVYQFITDSKQPSSVVRDKTRYTRSFRIRTETPITSTDEFCFTVPSQNQGFYLGLRDPNSCILVSRVLAYRRECAAKQTGLVSFPDTATSVDGQSRSVNAKCVDNAEPVSSSMNVQCLNNGLWSGLPQCRCKAGYREATVGGEKRCIACDAGTYRSASDAVDRCLTCPSNTFTVAVGTAECKCLTGYYRNNAGLASRCPSGQNEERAGLKCTQPPSKPRNVALSRGSTERTISIRWTAPSDLGDRSDLYYTVEHSDPSNVGRLINPTAAICLTATQFQITGLRPATDYLIRVTAHNGVSDQDPDGAFSRIAEITERTANAAPSSPVDVEGLCSVVVWKEPVMPNGDFVSYDVRFYRQGSSTGITRQVADTATFYVVQSNDTPSGSGALYVQVRAVNDVGVSAYSAGVPVCVAIPAPEPEPTIVPGPTITAPEPITAPGAVTEMDVLGCGVLAWKPPSNRGNGQPGYVVRFFDGNTYGTSNYREILRFFEDPDRRWARPDSMPSTRPIYADIRTGNDIGSRVLVGPYSVKVVVADSVLCASPVSTPAPVTDAPPPPTACPDVTCPIPQEPECPAAPACDSCCSACPTVLPCPEVSPINFLDNDEVPPTNIKPGTVRNVQIQGCGIITWEAPEEDGGDALEYRVRIFTGSTYQTTISSEKKVIATFDRWVLPDSLLPQRPLHILVKAKNSAGFSVEWSEQIDLNSSCLCSE